MADATEEGLSDGKAQQAAKWLERARAPAAHIECEEKRQAVNPDEGAKPVGQLQLTRFGICLRGGSRKVAGGERVTWPICARD